MSGLRPDSPRAAGRNRQFYERYGKDIFETGNPPQGSSASNASAARPAPFPVIPVLEPRVSPDPNLIAIPPENPTVTSSPLIPIPSNSTSFNLPIGSTPKPESMGVVSKFFKGLRDLVGINRLKCQNGGRNTDDGKCKCTDLFEGQTCDKRVCLNGGKLQRTSSPPYSYECKCPYPQYIDGLHCEAVRCANQAPLIREANHTWHCDCSNRFYVGQFCENFYAPIAVMVAPLILLAIFLICCYVCRLDWCPRRRTPRNSPSRRNENRRRRVPNPTSTERERIRANQRRINSAQEFLLPEESRVSSTTAPFPPVNGPPYVIRLDTIPTFNPNMIGGVEPSSFEGNAKPVDPPPSYDQAIRAPPAPDPPRYTERPDPHSILQRGSAPPASRSQSEAPPR